MNEKIEQMVADRIERAHGLIESANNKLESTDDRNPELLRQAAELYSQASREMDHAYKAANDSARGDVARPISGTEPPQ